MTVTGYSQIFELATGTTLTPASTPLPTGTGKALLFVTVNRNQLARAPVWATTSVFVADNTAGVRLFSGWCRAVVAGDDDGLSWSGRIPLSERTNFLKFNFRNDGGAKESMVALWIVEG